MSKKDELSKVDIPEIKDRQDDTLPAKYVQVLSWFSLFSLIIIDKVLGLINPHLPEYWYAVLFGTASESKIHAIIKDFKGGD